MSVSLPVAMHFFRNWSISKKILLGILPLFLVFVSLSIALNNHFQEQGMMEQAQRAAHTYADIIKESLVSMMVTNLEVDESFLDRVNTLHEFDTLHILVNDLKLRKEVLTPKNRQRIETRHKTLLPHDDIEREVLRTGQPMFVLKGNHFRGVVPFDATGVCQKCHAVPVGYTLGAVDFHISLLQISEAARENWQRSFFIFVGFMIVAIAFASILFTRFVSRPVETLVKATTAMSRGDLDSSILLEQLVPQEQSRDELAFLSLKFDSMRKSLKEKIAQLDEANRNLAERNAEVEEALTQLKHAQEELVKSERLAVTGRMTAQLSHEINNPIHNIHSLLESSLKKIDGQSKELISLALEEVTRMAKLTKQMLDFYRGSLVEVEKVPVEIGELLEHLIKENQHSFAERNVRCVLEVPLHLLPVDGSHDKLKQVFLNLVLNALDAMPTGGILTLRAYAKNNKIRIQVSDTGTGIRPEILSKIFDAFFTTKKEVSGVGLGLAVSYGIVQQHEGTISVESSVGTGTTFTIDLPTTKNHND